jgi:superfamily II DNA helicase RecQ
MAMLHIPRVAVDCRPSALDYIVENSIKELGFTSPTTDQIEVVTNFAKGKDVLVSLPTGSGKSVYFACLPNVFDKLAAKLSNWAIVIVVSPLNALMYDQVEKFKKRGLKVMLVSNKQNIEDSFANQCGEDRDFQLLYFSPEALLKSLPLWREVLFQWQERILSLAVDEAHLVEKWYLIYITLAAEYTFVFVGDMNFEQISHK